MTIWLLQTGERGEGGFVIGAFASREAARAAAVKWMREYPSFGGYKWTHKPYDARLEVSEDRWFRACDWLEVSSLEVEK